MKAFNIGDNYTGPVVQVLQRHAGQRMSSTQISDETTFTMTRVRRTMAELVAKGVVRSGGKRRNSHVPAYWLATDTVAEQIGQPAAAAGSGHVAPSREPYVMRPLDARLIGPRSYRPDAGLAAPGITINASVYDRSRP